MKTTYILTANASVAHVYAYLDNRKDQLQHIKTLNHNSSKQKEQDLIASDSGSYRSNGFSGGKLVPQTCHRTLEKALFAKEISRFLLAHKNNAQFSQLVFICAPEFLGLLHEHCPQILRHCIIEEYLKDYTKEEPQKIINLIWKPNTKVS